MNPCTGGNNEGCEVSDYEGACCATTTVRTVNEEGTGKNESVGSTYTRCFNIDDIIKSFDNNDILNLDISGAHGNGNSYDFKCADPNKVGDAAFASYLALGLSILLISSSSFWFRSLNYEQV